MHDADEEMQWGSPEGLPRMNPLQSQGSLRLRSQASLKGYEASALLRSPSFKVQRTHTCSHLVQVTRSTAPWPNVARRANRATFVNTNGVGHVTDQHCYLQHNGCQIVLVSK